MPKPVLVVSLPRRIFWTATLSMSTFRGNALTSQHQQYCQCYRARPALQKWSDLGYLNHVAGRRLVPVELGRHYLDEKWSSSSCRCHHSCGSTAARAMPTLFTPALRSDPSTSERYSTTLLLRVRRGARPKRGTGYGTALHRDKSHNLLAQVVGAMSGPVWKSNCCGTSPPV